MPIAWHAAPQQKGDSIEIEGADEVFYTGAYVSLPYAARDFCEGYKPKIKGDFPLIARNLLTGAEFNFRYTPSEWADPG